MAHQKDAVKIRSHEAVPVVHSKVFKRPTQLHASVVDQNLNRPDGRLNVFNGHLDCSILRHVEAAGMHSQAFSPQHCPDLLKLCNIAPIEHHRCASLSQCPRQRQADACR